jgi:hypothetical protein
MDPRAQGLVAAGSGAVGILFLFVWIRATNYLKRRYGWIEDERPRSPN